MTVVLGEASLKRGTKPVLETMEEVQKSATSNVICHHQNPTEHYTVNFAVNSNFT